MRSSLLLISLALGVVGPWLALTYMRPILLQVLRSLCTTGQGVEFWMRSAYVLAISGTLLLILSFGAFDERVGLAESIRRNAWLVLAGIFVTIAYITRTIQKSLPKPRPGRSLATPVNDLWEEGDARVADGPASSAGRARRSGVAAGQQVGGGLRHGDEGA